MLWNESPSTDFIFLSKSPAAWYFLCPVPSVSAMDAQALPFLFSASRKMCVLWVTLLSTRPALICQRPSLKFRGIFHRQVSHRSPSPRGCNSLSSDRPGQAPKDDRIVIASIKTKCVTPKWAPSPTQRSTLCPHHPYASVLSNFSPRDQRWLNKLDSATRVSCRACIPDHTASLISFRLEVACRTCCNRTPRGSGSLLG